MVQVSNVDGVGFDQFTPVTVEMLSDDRTKVLNGGKIVPSALLSTDARGQLGLGSSPVDAGPELTTTDASGNPYTGWAWIVADESNGPAWTEAWYHPCVC